MGCVKKALESARPGGWPLSFTVNTPKPADAPKPDAKKEGEEKEEEESEAVKLAAAVLDLKVPRTNPLVISWEWPPHALLSILPHDILYFTPWQVKALNTYSAAGGSKDGDWDALCGEAVSSMGGGSSLDPRGRYF